MDRSCRTRRRRRAPARPRTGRGSGYRRSSASDWSAASIVACMPAGSEMLPVRTSPSSLPVRPMKKPLQRRVRAWLPTSWLKQTAFLTPAVLESLAGAEASLVLGLADVGEDAEIPEDVRARVHRHDRDPGRDRLLDRRAERVRVRDRHDEAGRLLGDGGVDQGGHAGHVALRARGAVVGRHAHVGRSGLDAVADDAPEPVLRLAVGDDLDLDVAALDERAVEPSGGRARRSACAATGPRRSSPQPASARNFLLADSCRSFSSLDLTCAADPLSPARQADPTDRCCRFAARRPPWTPPFTDRPAGPQPGISSSRTGRCSWSERSAASAMRSAARPSRAMHGLRDLAAGHRDEFDELGGVGGLEPIEEVRPRRPRRRRDAGLDGAHRRPRPEAHADDVLEPNSSARMS